MTAKSLEDVPTTPIRRAPFVAMTVLFTVTALILAFVGSQLSRRGHWLPQPPIEIGGWTGAELPIARGAVEQLGSPKTIGFSYTDLFSDSIEVHVIATNSFESYLDPRTTMSFYRYAMTAQKEIPLFGKDGPVRGLVFRSPDTSDTRILMYYWIQYRDGKTNATDTLQQKDDFLPRLRLGTAASLQGTENCVVRVMAKIFPGDREGVQARRYVEEICQALHQSFKEQGQKGDTK